MKKILISFNILIFGNLAAVIHTGNVLVKDKKRILVIGDCHLTDNRTNAEELEETKSAELFICLLDYFYNLKSKNHWILEARDAEISKYSANLSKFDLKEQMVFTDLNGWFGLINGLPLYFKHNVYKNLSFTFDDIRQNLGVLSQLPKGLRILTGFSQDFDLINFWSARIHQINIKAQDCLDQLKQAKEQLVVKANKLKLSKSATLFIKNLLVKVDEEYNKIVKIFDDCDNDSTLLDVLNKLLSKSRKDFNHIADISVLCAMTDLGFILALLEHLNRHDRIVVYVGDAHAQTLIDFLNVLGFDFAYKYAKSNVKIGKCQFTQEEFKKMINIFLPESIGNLKTTYSVSPCNLDIDKKIEQLKISDDKKKACANNGCKKTGTKRCGSCKLVCYCSVECQQADWQAHKINCKKKGDNTVKK